MSNRAKIVINGKRVSFIANGNCSLSMPIKVTEFNYAIDNDFVVVASGDGNTFFFTVAGRKYLRELKVRQFGVVEKHIRKQLAS
jgi:hypothetical protein